MGNGSFPGPLPLLSLNHVSLVCKSIERSVEFYHKVLGFQIIKRPSTFDFEGAWLFNYGVGIHLLKCKSVDDLPRKSEIINPRDNHVSFQCTDVGVVEKKIQEMKIKYEKRVVEEGGIYVDQIFFHDPDGYMIEICNCENLPVVPLGDCESNPHSHCRSRSTSFWYNAPKSTAKVDGMKESYSEISLVPIHSSSLQPDFKKDVEGGGEEDRRCRSQVEGIKDMKPLFLDIMNFYL